MPRRALKTEANLVVLMAVHNRKDSAIEAISSLMASAQQADVGVQIVVVDAGSIDGTPEAISALFPDVVIVPTGPESYWANSMRIAWESSRGVNRDFTVWLNEDVVLNSGSVSTLIESAKSTNYRAIIVGAVVDPDTKELTYGGQIRGPWYRRLRSSWIGVSGGLERADYANGNILLVPFQIDLKLGGFPQGFSHAMADFVYTFRANRRGYSVIQAPGWLGTCSNPHRESWRSKHLKFRERLRLLLAPKGLPPRDWLRFCFLLGGIMAPLYFLNPYMSLIGDSLLDGLKRLGRLPGQSGR